MRDRSKRDLLTEAVVRLPRQQPAIDFTARTLRELERRAEHDEQRSLGLIRATAIAILVAVVLVLGVGYQRQREADRAYRAQVQELQNRYQVLLEEVTTVRRQVAEPDTRIYLGGDDSLDLVLDLGRLQPASLSTAESPSVRPASLEQ